MRVQPVLFSQVQSVGSVSGVNNKPYFNLAHDTFEKTSKTYNAVSFSGITGRGEVKQRGMMFHISSLPAERSCCGQFLDPETDDFIDFLVKSKQTHWIMNPLNQLGEDLCPYNANGRFSRNKYLVNLNVLTSEKYGNLLEESELPDDIPMPAFTLDALRKQKDPRFEKAYSRFEKLDESHPLKQEYNRFEEDNKSLWLETYSIYDALSKEFGDSWKEWPERLQTLPETHKGARLALPLRFELGEMRQPKDTVDRVMNNIGLFKFEQFMYDKQFKEFKQKLDDNGIRLILDLPIGVSPVGVDVWSNKNMFLLDENLEPAKVSGCPPEGNYSYTQMWGHALYNYDSPEFWEYQENSLRQLLREGDLRLDHFPGYINRAEIPVSYTKKDGTVLEGHDIFLPKRKGGMGVAFYPPEWTVNIDEKRSPNGENMFKLFKRVATEEGLKPEDCYILESFGPMTETGAYKKFHEEFGGDFVSQRVPVAMGIYNKPAEQGNFALLTGNHDLPPLKEYIDKYLASGDRTFGKFCQKELELTKDGMKDSDVVMTELMKWHYTRKNVKQVQTTLQDALQIRYRPNIPGSHNGMIEKYEMQTTPEALLPFWSKVFPKGFLKRDNKDGINPGYAEAADRFVKMMEELYQ